MRPSDSTTQLGLPRPGKAVIGLMVAVLVVWLSFAIGLNWGNVSGDLFALLAGDTSAVLHGQVWRLFTAPLLHTPSGARAVSHLLSALFGLYFLGTSLEEAWG